MKIEGVSPADASPEQRQIATVQYLININNYATSMDNHLRSIKNMMIFFTILLIIGLLFQGCAALGLT